VSREFILMSACMTTALLAAPRIARAANEAKAHAKVALVDAIDLPERMEETRTRLRELFETSVRERGLVAVPAGAPSCGETSCLAELARTAGADALIVARGGRSAERDYHVELALWQPSSAQVIPAVADCTFCTGPQMAEAVVKATRPLLDRIVASGITTAANPPPSPAGTAPAILPPSDKLDAHGGRRILGWSLVGLGAATAIAGSIIWNLDGKGTDCGAGSSCRNVYDTRTEGIALVAVGAVGAGAGLWLVLDPLGRRDLAVTVGPSGASVAGRF
jgi:hypothetical protein